MSYANLPAGIGRKSRDLHAIDCSTRTWRRVSIRWSVEGFFVTWPSCKLDGEAFSLEITSVYENSSGRANGDLRMKSRTKY